MKKVLITGSTGMLGSAVIQAFLVDDRYTVVGMGRSVTTLLDKKQQIVVDFSEPSSLNAIDISPDIVIHTAAITDLTLCESNPELANNVHVKATAEIVKKVKPTGFAVYISTDSVFDGRKGMYTESDMPNPLNVYAATKLKGEEAGRDLHDNFMVIRTNIYGCHYPLKNSLAEWAFKEWSAGKTISGFTDVVFNALYTDQLAWAIKNIVDKDIFYPILNIASEEVVSKYDFLNMFRRRLDIKEAQLIATTSDQYPSAIKRPLNTSLDISLLKTFYIAPLMMKGLDKCLNDLRSPKANPIGIR